MSGLAFERRLDVQTAQKIERSELGYADDRFVFYEPAEWRTLQRALPKRSVTDDDVFVDLGCGMGRMVLRAAEYRFAKVIGVELSSGLIAIAERNLERNRDRLRCRNIELIHADVTAYELDDSVTVVFFNNPFTGEIFQAAIDNLRRSLERRPRRLRIVYRHPTEHERLLATGWVRAVSQWQKGAWRGRGRGVTIRSYEAVPERLTP